MNTSLREACVRPPGVYLRDVLAELSGSLHPLGGRVVMKDDVRRHELEQAVNVLGDPRISVGLDQTPQPVAIHAKQSIDPGVSGEIWGSTREPKIDCCDVRTEVVAFGELLEDSC